MGSNPIPSANLTTNEKGAIGVAMTTADLVSRRYYVFLPVDGSYPVDLIVGDAAMRLCRLQVKYRDGSDGRLAIRQSSVVNGVRVPIDRAKIDGWAVYCPQSRFVYYVPLRAVSEACGEFSIPVAQPALGIIEDYHDPAWLWR